MISYADNGTTTGEDKWNDENTIEVSDAEMLHELFDALNETSFYGSLKIVLRSDIVTDKGVYLYTDNEDNEVLIDLNGHSITVDSDNVADQHVLSVGEKANVIITGNGSLISKNSEAAFHPSAVFVHGGHVTIENGTYEARSTILVSKSLFESRTSKVIINGGTFTGETPLTVDDGNVTVNDGEFTCIRYDSAWNGDYEKCVIINSNGALVIHGGKFDNSVVPKGNVFISAGRLSIDGGSFIGPSLLNNNNFWDNSSKNIYMISGGDFTGADSIFRIINPIPSDQLIVTGGMFTDNQKEELAESNKRGDSDYNLATDLGNYWEEEEPVCEYTGKALRPSINMNVTLSDGYHSLGMSDRFRFETVYKNNRDIGLATVIYTGKGELKGTVTATFRIVPKKAVWKTVKGGKKSFTVAVKAQKGGVRYQIQYKTGKGKWKTKRTNKTKLTVKNLKSKKKYQVRVRAFKKVKGKTYYGKWSKTRTIKVR
ncbi:MAG: fibronectin type III domain-containing protein [Oscillospiraceae bacterium]|nr:fibronectin type III domain-containing protein [Oscillospiraceae bacterium]